MLDNQWKPITTAPKDGSRILGTSNSTQVHCYYFHQTDKQWWIDYADGPSWQPTHWMNVPEYCETPKISLLDAIFMVE
jgi:hypothetical protein